MCFKKRIIIHFHTLFFGSQFSGSEVSASNVFPKKYFYGIYLKMSIMHNEKHKIGKIAGKIYHPCYDTVSS